MTSMLRLAWRQQRVGFRSMAIGGALYAAIQAGTFTVAAGSTPPARAAFGVQIQSLGRQVSYLLPIPQRADTIGGYVHWRGGAEELPEGHAPKGEAAAEEDQRDHVQCRARDGGALHAAELLFHCIIPLLACKGLA